MKNINSLRRTYLRHILFQCIHLHWRYANNERPDNERPNNERPSMLYRLTPIMAILELSVWTYPNSVRRSPTVRPKPFHTSFPSHNILPLASRLSWPHCPGLDAPVPVLLFEINLFFHVGFFNNIYGGKNDLYTPTFSCTHYIQHTTRALEYILYFKMHPEFYLHDIPVLQFNFATFWSVKARGLNTSGQLFLEKSARRQVPEEFIDPRAIFPLPTPSKAFEGSSHGPSIDVRCTAPVSQRQKEVCPPPTLKRKRSLSEDWVADPKMPMGMEGKGKGKEKVSDPLNYTDDGDSSTIRRWCILPPSSLESASTPAVLLGLAALGRPRYAYPCSRPQGRGPPSGSLEHVKRAAPTWTTTMPTATTSLALKDAREMRRSYAAAGKNRARVPPRSLRR